MGSLGTSAARGVGHTLNEDAYPAMMLEVSEGDVGKLGLGYVG
jgi:hypothetical protein